MPVALVVTNKNAEQNTTSTSPDPEVLEDAPDSESACDKNCILFTHCNETCAAGAEWAVMIDAQKHCFHTSGSQLLAFFRRARYKSFVFQYIAQDHSPKQSNSNYHRLRPGFSNNILVFRATGINIGRNSPRPFILKSKFVRKC